MKFKRVNIDTGKNNLGFVLEKKIKEYKERVDYEVDETGNAYTILSEKLKSVVWPDDYFWYDDSVVVIDRQGKIESWRFAADNPREPYEKVTKDTIKELAGENKEIDKFFNNSPKSSNLPTNLVIGGTLLAVISLILSLVIKKLRK